jgi:hypothetical protein
VSFDPVAVACQAEGGAEALLRAGLTEPTDGPAGTVLAALPDRGYAEQLAKGPLALALVDSLSELVGFVLPWAPTVDGGVDRLVALCSDGIAVVGSGLSCRPAEAGAFESVRGVSVTVTPGADIATWAVPPDTAFAARASVRLWCASMLVGVAQASLHDATVYGSERIVFGKPVFGHQANAFDLAVCATGVEAARQALGRASQRAEPAAFGWAASQAYLQARSAALGATDFGVQMHGGHGYLQGRPTERYFREARMLSLLCGGADAALDDLTDRALDEPDWTWP